MAKDVENERSVIETRFVALTKAKMKALAVSKEIAAALYLGGFGALGLLFSSILMGLRSPVAQAIAMGTGILGLLAFAWIKSKIEIDRFQASQQATKNILECELLQEKNELSRQAVITEQTEKALHDAIKSVMESGVSKEGKANILEKLIKNYFAHNSPFGPMERGELIVKVELADEPTPDTST